MRSIAISPSRGRPERTKVMIDSFLDTVVSNTYLVFVLDDDDERLPDYMKLLSNKSEIYSFCVRPRATITSHFNDAFLTFMDWDFFHLTNDDFVYHTPGWDQIFIDKLKECGPGIAFGNDGINGVNLCSAPFISGEIVRAVGWLQWPGLIHLYGDQVWKKIGSELRRLFYVPGVSIEHRHWQVGKAEVDNISKRTNSQEMFRVDDESFRRWMATEFKQDIERIRKCLKLV